MQSYILPVMFHPDNELPLIDVTVNGKHFKAYLDSGALFDLNMPKETLEQLGATLTGKEWKSRGLASETALVKEYQAQVQLGKAPPQTVFVLEYKDWFFSIDDTDPLEDSLNLIPVFVGLNLLMPYSVYINFPDNEIELFSTINTPSSVNQWASFPCVITNNGLEFDAFQGNTRIRVLFDTGSNVSFLIHSPTDLISNTIESDDEPTARILPTLKIGSVTTDLRVLKVPEEARTISADLILGCNFLKDHPVFIDFKNNLMWMKK